MKSENSKNWDNKPHISMGQCKKDAIPLLPHWRYLFLALTHRYVMCKKYLIDHGNLNNKGKKFYTNTNFSDIWTK